MAQTTAAPGLARERGQQRRQPERVRLVEPRGRLVDEQQRRPRRQRPRDRDANLLAGREPRDPLAGALGEPDRGEHLVRVALEPADLLAELDVLARAQERDEAALLRHERDLAAAQLGASAAVERVHGRVADEHLARIGQVEPGEQVEQRRLPRAGRAGDGGQASARELGVEAGEDARGGRAVAVRLDDSAQHAPPARLPEPARAARAPARAARRRRPRR